MTLKSLIKLFGDKHCSKIYVKELKRNNNSKQQIYIATGDTKILNLFPIEEFYEETSGKRKKSTFHAHVNFSWLDAEGKVFPAPRAKFILYPDYPEVRFSGFVSGCKKAPSEILNNMIVGRLLFFGISNEGNVYGYVVNPDDEIALEFKKLKNLDKTGIIYTIGIISDSLIKDTRERLLAELKKIHLKGWIESKQLGKNNIVSPCLTDRCGGPTLEAELGIIQNGRSEPDYLGWEIKQFGVKAFSKLAGAKITLMTPEPDGGYYKEKGVPDFLNKYGYTSKRLDDRMDFTGQHKIGITQANTNLKLVIHGYDFASNKIREASKGVYLLDKKENIAASWSFSRLLEKFKKYDKASYIPSIKKMEPVRQYHYSNKILIGVGTDFSYFMKALNEGTIYYDPAVRIKDVSTKPNQKTRNQFRIMSQSLSSLYGSMEEINLLEL
jgi:hypothetical protein